MLTLQPEGYTLYFRAVTVVSDLNGVWADDPRVVERYHNDYNFSGNFAILITDEQPKLFGEGWRFESDLEKLVNINIISNDYDAFDEAYLRARVASGTQYQVIFQMNYDIFHQFLCYLVEEEVIEQTPEIDAFLSHYSDCACDDDFDDDDLEE